MTLDPYEGVAERYDLASDPLNLETSAWARFYRQPFADHRVQSVLDCACGTGRHLLLFHSLGPETTGSDVSAAMLAQAGKNLANLGVEIPMHQADYRRLPKTFGRCFDAVVCLGAIGYMPNEAEVLRAFRSMKAVLCEGGLLVLTVVLTDKQWTQRPGFILNANTRDMSRLFVIDYLERSARYNVLDIFHSEERRGLEVWSIELTVLLQADQQRLLDRAGFQRVAFYGSPAFDPYDRATSDQLVTVARK